MFRAKSFSLFFSGVMSLVRFLGFKLIGSTDIKACVMGSHTVPSLI